MPSMTVMGVALGGIIASVANALQIQVFNGLYGNFAVLCTDFENHRTDTQYEDALIAKTFVFQFVNSFASLFYIAFVKPYIPEIDPCTGDNCMKELQVSLGTIFLIRLTVGNFTAVAVPAINRRLNDKAIQQYDKLHKVTEVEHAAMLGTYDVMLGTFTDYANLIILYGYTTMFVCAFPLAVINAFVNNYASMRIDAWKLCQEFRRPEPRSQEDIGTWYIILEAVSLIAVLTNSALVAFTGSQLEDYTWTWRVWIFIIMSAGILSVKYLVRYVNKSFIYNTFSYVVLFS
jgi:anoctamin-10/anoctamin-7